MLGADVVMAQLTRFIPAQLEDALGARSERDLDGHEARAATDDLLDLDAGILQADAKALQGLGRHAGPFANQSQQNLLGANEVVAKPPRLFLGQHDDLDGFLSKSLKHVAPLILH
ncbi:hypothetical protein D3C78_1276980 [compost metagenome]